MLIDCNRSRTVLARPPHPSVIGDVLVAALEGFGGNQAALAVELGVTRATVSRWMSGQSIPDVASCLRLAKITGRTPRDVFCLAGHDPNLLPTESQISNDTELASRLRQWARRLGGLPMAERAMALSLLDGMVKSVCQSLGDGELRRELANRSRAHDRIS